MTVSSGFFNSVNHDRLYDAVQVSEMFDGIIIDGVYENVGDAFMVTANPNVNNSVIVGTGRAWFDHTWTKNDSQYSITLEPSTVMLSRIDAIVIDIDRRQTVRSNSIKCITGAVSEIPTKPVLINEELHKQYPIAYITVPAGEDAPISQSQIEYVVGTESCPIVTGILEAQNLDNLWQQLNSEFDAWWDGIKDTLDENTVTNLQNQINDIKEKMESLSSYGISKESYEFAKNASITQSAEAYRSAYWTFLPDGYIAALGWLGNPNDTSTTIGSLTGPDGASKSPVFEIYNLDLTRIHRTTIMNPNTAAGGKDVPVLRSGSLRIVHSEIDSYPATIIIAGCGDSQDSDNDRYSYYRYKPFVEIFTFTITAEHAVSVTNVRSAESKWDSVKHIFTYFAGARTYVSEIQAYPQENVICCSAVYDGSAESSLSNTTQFQVVPFKISYSGELLGIGSSAERIPLIAGSSIPSSKTAFNYTTNSSIYCSYPIASQKDRTKYSLFNVVTLEPLSSEYNISNTLGTNNSQIKILERNVSFISKNGTKIITMSGSTVGQYEESELPPFMSIKFGFSGSQSDLPTGTFEYGFLSDDKNVLYVVVNNADYASYISGGNGISIFGPAGSGGLIPNGGGVYYPASSLFILPRKLIWYSKEQKKMRLLPFWSYCVVGVNNIGPVSSNYTANMPIAIDPTGSNVISGHIITVSW